MKQKVKNLLSTFGEMWKNSKEATDLVRQFSRFLPFLAFSVSIVGAVRTLGLLTFVGFFWGYAEKQGFDARRNIVMVFWIYITLMVISTCTTNLLRVYMIKRKNAFGYFMEDHFTKLIHQKLVSVGIATRTSGTFSKMYNRTHANVLKNATLEFFQFKAKVISMAVALSVTIAALVFVNIWMLLCISLVAVFSVKMRVRRYRRFYDNTNERNRLRNRTGEYESVITRRDSYIQNFFFGTIPYFTGQFSKKRSEFRHKNDQESIDDAKNDVFVSLMRILPVLVFGFSVYHYVQKADVQSILILLGCYKSMENAIITFFRLYSDYDEELYQFRDWKTFLAFSGMDESNCKDYSPQNIPEIQLDHVTFTYPEVTAPALVDVSLIIPPAQSIALIGNNGSGKSTLISLLTKVRIPQQGDVYFDSVSTKTITQISIAKFVCWIAGNCDLLELPLYESVCGCSLETVDWGRLNKAAEITGANLYISKLPHGWHTSLDTTDEHHTEGFSDGQKQRLNLTAALYRALDPEVQVVIFDEPMAHCDSDIKTLFYQSIQKLGKTVIAAIHDPSYLHLFERVIKIENGRIVSDIK